MTHKEIETALEAMIDSQGMVAVLTALEIICDEKANHLRHNWQDTATARVWERGSSAIGKALRAVDWPL